MKQSLKTILGVALLTIVPTLLVWLPFALRLDQFWGIPLSKNGMATIVANYDGPLYLIVAKTFYDPALIKQFQFNLPVEYYSAHLPVFPLFIRIFSTVFGTLYSMLAVTVGSAFLAIWFFRKFISQYVSDMNAWYLTAVFAIFPARWLIVRSVGSPEPLFIASIIAAIYFFQKGKYLTSALWTALATTTKTPGILILVAVGASTLVPEINNFVGIHFTNFTKFFKLKKLLPFLIVPLAIFGVFYIYKLRLNDFWAYFHSGDNIHLFFPPFQIFNYAAAWVGTFWQEEIIFIYLLGGFAVIKLIKEKTGIVAWFSLIFFILTLFIAHRDLVRYSLPLVPFLIFAYRDQLVKNEFKIVFMLLLIPIYLFSLAFISQNVMPIADWSPFL